MSVRIEKNTDQRGGYVLRAECILPRDVEEVFPFFADAYQLEAITPPWLNFRVLTPRPIEMHAGRLIDYKLRLRGLPIRWKTKISAWEPNERFVDEALKSPYKFWHHEHLFEPCEDGTRVIDIVHYGVPGGDLIHSLFVRREVQKIFEYRQQVLRGTFPAVNEPLVAAAVLS